MGYLLTFQGGYEVLRDFTTVDAAYLDGSTANRTFDFTNKPTHAKALTPNHNAIEVVFPVGRKFLSNPNSVDATNDFIFGGRFWGYNASGPAEHICDVSCTVGTANIQDSTHALWVDTIVVANDTHTASCSVADSGNNRIAKLIFDTIGYSWLMFDTTVDPSMSVEVFYRPY